MEKTQINRQTLLEILQTNRAQHIQEYQEAVADHKALCIKFAKENSKAAKANLKAVIAGKLNAHFNNMSGAPVEPVSHEKEYNRAIRMVELEVRDTVELEEDVFNQLVMDEWDWKQQFATSNSLYKIALGH